MGVYLDNAATTSLDPEVLNAMMPYFTELYGNPSSQHSAGRSVRSAIEDARKKIAHLINAQPGDIVFTSGGTESNNTIIKGAVRDLGVKHIIISAIEHHCVSHTVEYLEKTDQIKLTVLPVNENGQIIIGELEKALAETNEKTLVSLIHANNEIGVMIDIDQVAHICKSYGAFFHSDTVQTFAHYLLDIQKTPVDFISAAAHKFHGPKGVGFFYMRKTAKVQASIHGGSQERSMRAGTENVASIIGMTKAAQLAYDNLSLDQSHIKGLKAYLIEKVKTELPQVEFNGLVDDSSLYTVLSLSLPSHAMGSLLLFQLDMLGICVSGGSACSSGASVGSHVIQALGKPSDRIPLRVSFSKYNSKEDIDFLVNTLKNLYE